MKGDPAGRLQCAVPTELYGKAMDRLLASLALLCVLSPLSALACDVQAESREVQRLYAEKVATLPGDRVAAIGAKLKDAGRLHEVGKNQEACERFVELRAILTMPQDQVGLRKLE